MREELEGAGLHDQAEAAARLWPLTRPMGLALASSQPSTVYTADRVWTQVPQSVAFEVVCIWPDQALHEALPRV